MSVGRYCLLVFLCLTVIFSQPIFTTSQDKFKHNPYLSDDQKVEIEHLLSDHSPLFTSLSEKLPRPTADQLKLLHQQYRSTIVRSVLGNVIGGAGVGCAGGSVLGGPIGCAVGSGVFGVIGVGKTIIDLLNDANTYAIAVMRASNHKYYSPSRISNQGLQSALRQLAAEMDNLPPQFRHFNTRVFTYNMEHTDPNVNMTELVVNISTFLQQAELSYRNPAAADVQLDPTTISDLITTITNAWSNHHDNKLHKDTAVDVIMGQDAVGFIKVEYEYQWELKNTWYFFTSKTLRLKLIKKTMWFTNEQEFRDFLNSVY